METSQVKSLRERIDYLEEEIRQMRDILMPPDNPFMGRFGLSRQQATIINALHKNNGELPAKRIDQLMVEFAHQERNEDLSHSYVRARVSISKLRKRLNRYGIVINHHSGFGYKLTKESKDKLNKMLKSAE
jgi:hypothetical protein